MNKVKSMAQTIGEAISLIQKLDQFDIGDIRMESNEPTYHHVTHKYRDEIVIPIIAIENNITFFTNKGERYIIFVDGVKAKVVDVQEKHICELEETIKRLYNCDCWTFVKKWYATYKNMESMVFVCIKVRKEG